MFFYGCCVINNNNALISFSFSQYLRNKNSIIILTSIPTFFYIFLVLFEEDLLFFFLYMYAFRKSYNFSFVFRVIENLQNLTLVSQSAFKKIIFIKIIKSYFSLFVVVIRSFIIHLKKNKKKSNLIRIFDTYDEFVTQFYKRL